MNKIKYIAILFLAALFLNSCRTTTHTSKRGGFVPDVDLVKLQVSMDDFEVVGETEISVSYHRYFGIITVIDEVNGVKYNPYDLYRTRIKGVSFGASSKLGKATGKIIEEIPDASWYHVVYDKRKHVPLMFGRVTNETALIRAYNIKYKK